MKRAYTALTERNERGFTLIELLIVIAIIAVLAALILAALTSAQRGSRDSRRRSDIAQYKNALVQFQSDKNKFPNAASATNIATVTTASGEFVQFDSYINPRPTPPGGTGAQATYNYFGDDSNFCLYVQAERNTNQWIVATATAQYNDKTAACTAPNTY